MTGVQYQIQDYAGSPAEGLLIRLQPALCPTEDQFYEFCRINSDLRIERTADGGVMVMEPAGWQTGEQNAEITYQLQGWSTNNGTGRAVDSSAGYRLANGAIRSPDASWIRNERLASITPEQRSKFLPMCPDFVVELRSPTDRLHRLQDKMAEYMANGAQLGWLIDPLQRQVFVYRPGVDIELLDAPEVVSADPLLPGFQLRLTSVW